MQSLSKVALLLLAFACLQAYGAYIRQNVFANADCAGPSSLRPISAFYALQDACTQEFIDQTLQYTANASHAIFNRYEVPNDTITCTGTPDFVATFPLEECVPDEFEIANVITEVVETVDWSNTNTFGFFGQVYSIGVYLGTCGAPGALQNVAVLSSECIPLTTEIGDGFAQTCNATHYIVTFYDNCTSRVEVGVQEAPLGCDPSTESIGYVVIDACGEQQTPPLPSTTGEATTGDATTDAGTTTSAGTSGATSSSTSSSTSSTSSAATTATPAPSAAPTREPSTSPASSLVLSLSALVLAVAVSLF